MGIEQQLSSVLSDFARTLVTDFPIQAILDQLVLRIVDVLPISSAGVTLISPGAAPHYIAASDDSALRFEQIQTELDEGPCLEAYNTGDAVSIPDLRNNHRFPNFSRRAIEEGLAAVFTFPLRQGDHQLGALDLYRTTPGPLNTAEMAAAQTLAEVTTAYLLNAQARDALKDSAERSHKNSLHDALTGLPNRTLLFQRLDHAMLRNRRSKKIVAVLFVDLDLFKAINDTYGHNVGDQLLGAVAERLTGLLRPGDTLARLSGDEFVILCEDLDEASQVDHLAARILDALSESFVLTGAEVQITASVGIAFAGPEETIPQQVLHDADTAMYQAKRKGGARHGVIDLREQGLANQRASLNRDLRGALTRGELEIEYQPIMTTVDGRIIGVEALLRWAHPTLGIIKPGTVIPLAEQFGQITEIGCWVLERACLDRHRWQCHHQHDRLGISVNVSTDQLMAADFANTVSAILTATQTDPTLVTLEVTESVFVQDSERALLVLNDLKRLGVMLALDDFGTGYSSLSYLKGFPVDIVKIDRIFIADLDRNPASRLIVSAIVGLAHGLSMNVVAEGVETYEQFEAIAALDCEAYQGFLFARPTSADELETLLTRGDFDVKIPLNP
ncbi:MAG: EAL domain-containing protein [Actinomycetota bacterium]